MEKEDTESGQTKNVGDVSGDFWNASCCCRLHRGGEELGPGITRSEMLLAQCPRPLGGQMLGEGGVGDLLGEQGKAGIMRDSLLWL
jgi:hypothetical protein